jgi:hypothetical protein
MFSQQLTQLDLTSNILSGFSFTGRYQTCCYSIMEKEQRLVDSESG